MRHAPCPPISLAIEALDEKYLIWRQTLLVVPSMGAVVLDGVRLATSSRIDQTDWYEIGVRDRVGLGDGQGVALDGLDGSPYVDDLHPPLEKSLGLFR